MKKYIQRSVEKLIVDYLDCFPVVALTGPRQSGKSTLLKHLLKDEYRYVSFDHFKNHQLFYDDPEKFMEIYSDKVIFDEVQKAPEIFDFIKVAVDEDRGNYGKFILTGSSQFSFIKSISESLAGRIGLLTLLPFHREEIPVAQQETSLYLGGFPEQVLRNYKKSDRWFDSYLETYLEKDVKLIFNIGDMRDFRRCIALLAANVSQLLNMSEISKEIGVTVATIKKWISILEASYLIFLLPPYHNNRNKRIVKSPKIYFYDTGLLTYLLGLPSAKIIEKGPMAGAIFENYVISEVQKIYINRLPKHRLFFYKETQGLEVDLIIQEQDHRKLIEIKSSSSFRAHMVNGIEKCIQKDDRGYLIYRGEDVPYASPIEILNFKKFLKLRQV